MKKFKTHNKKTPAEKVEKKSRKVGIMGYTIIFIMVSSVIGFIWAGNASQVERYNGHKFVKQGNNWITKLDGRNIAFSYFPTYVEDIKVDQNSINKLKTPVIQFTYDTNDTFVHDIAQAEYMLIQNIQDRGQFATIGFKEENSYNIPIITCDNATGTSPVIEFKTGNKTSIESNANCITITANSGYDFVRAKDRYLYGLYGVING